MFRFKVYSLEAGRTDAYKKATVIAWCHAVEVGIGANLLWGFQSSGLGNLLGFR